MASTAGPAQRRLRSDAQRNRDLLVTSARAAFAERGADAPLEQIAREAGVAIGTLYRHFPTRVDLLLAVYEDRLREVIAIGQDALTCADAWHGFSRYLEALCGMPAGDQGLNDFVSMRFPACEQTEAMHDRICSLVGQVLTRVQREGRARADVTKFDVMTVIWSNNRVLELTRAIAPKAWRRHLHLMLAALSTTPTPTLPGPAVTDAQLYRAMADRSS